MANQLALKGGTPVRTKPFSPWPIIDDEERKLLLAVFDSGVWSFGGPKEAEFSQKFAEFTGAKFAFCVANGSVSLEIALRALGVGPGDEVLVPALTWHATAWAVVQVGATPVFVDVRESDWCMDPADARAKLTPRTRALIPVHLYSQIAAMDELLAIARERKLVILEDCAHMHGGRWGDRGIGVVGDIGSFSFQQSKGMTSGEGGMLTTDSEELARRIYGFKNCGRPWKDGRFGFGGNYRITEFQAAILLPQLERLPAQLKTKAANAALLREKLAKIPGLQTTARKPKVTREGMYGFQVRFDPDAFGGMPPEILMSALKAEGIPTQAPYSVVFRSPLWTSGEKLLKFAPGESAAQRLGLGAECPVAERLAGEEGVVLLHHLFLGDASDMDDIAAAFAKLQQNAGELRLDVLEKKARRVARSFLKKVGFGS